MNLMPPAPDTVLVRRDDVGPFLPPAEVGVRVDLAETPAGLRVRIGSEAELSRVVLRWRTPVAPDAFILGDAWERTYGDQQWRHLQPDRVLPWYWLAFDPATRTTRGMGVRVRPSAFCSWLVDDDGVVLSLDVRNGGSAVRLAGRTLDAATVVAVQGEEGETPWAVHRRLCRSMCDDPLPSPGPLVGANNWYYAYSAFTPDDVLADARTIVELADGHPVRPFSVIDAGWTPGSGCPGGPWHTGTPGVFDDMAALAARIVELGARPGIWVRPAALTTVDDPDRLRTGPVCMAEQPLDLSLEANLAVIGEDIARLRGWGYELIKHDFSTMDLFARWGPLLGAELTDPGWSMADRSVTNAEVLLRFYRTVHDAAGDAVVLGCNTVGHLAAGLVHLQRTGDDTSGKRWERTRRMGVNTLAFRLAQHDTFFGLDADCVAATPATPWERNRQFLDLVAHSGTALFVSVDPRSRSPRVDADLRAAVRIALDGGDPDGVEALDWLHTTAPRRWRVGARERHFDWTEPAGAWPPLE